MRTLAELLEELEVESKDDVVIVNSNPSYLETRERFSGLKDAADKRAEISEEERNALLAQHIIYYYP